MPYIAAGLLASITIRVFFELQDYGPESAIRRFLESVRTNNPTELLGVVTDPPIQGVNERRMVGALGVWDRNRVTSQVGRLERTGNEVRAAVIFSFPNGTIWSSVWVVERRGRMWLVDANKTATIFWDGLPPQ
jgi:hypothetical protein